MASCISVETESFHYQDGFNQAKKAADMAPHVGHCVPLYLKQLKVTTLIIVAGGEPWLVHVSTAQDDWALSEKYLLTALSVSSRFDTIKNLWTQITLPCANMFFFFKYDFKLFSVSCICTRVSYTCGMACSHNMLPNTSLFFFHPPLTELVWCAFQSYYLVLECYHLFLLQLALSVTREKKQYFINAKFSIT